MLDDLPNPRLAVYIFLEMIALGFALEAVAAFMRGDAWWKWTSALMMGVVFMILGVKSEQIVKRCSPYLNSRLIWTAAFGVLSLYLLYFLQRLAAPELTMNLHQRLHGAPGYAVVGLVGATLWCGCWWLTGVMLKPSIQTDATKQPTATAEVEKPPTLLDLFKRDFPNTLKASDNEDAYTMHSPDGSTLKIKRQTYMDFPAKTKFAGFFISMPGPPSQDMNGQKTFTACMQLLQIDAVNQTFDHVGSQVAVLAGQGDQMTSIKDLTFSGRVLIYHEEFLTIPQKAEILKAYEAKGLAVTFMGSDYLGTQVIAWHQQHDLKGMH